MEIIVGLFALLFLLPLVGLLVGFVLLPFLLLMRLAGFVLRLGVWLVGAVAGALLLIPLGLLLLPLGLLLLPVLLLVGGLLLLKLVLLAVPLVALGLLLWALLAFTRSPAAA